MTTKIKITIRAIDDAVLVGVLKRLGLYEGVVEGRYRCFSCGRRITFSNLGGYYHPVDKFKYS